MLPGNFHYGRDPRETTRGPNKQEELETQTGELANQHQPGRIKALSRMMQHQVPIYDAATMAPMFKSQNTPNQPPRTPVKPTRPYSEFTKPPLVMNTDMEPSVGSSCISGSDNEYSKPSRRSRPSSAQRNRRRAANRWNSVERGENTSTRGRQQFTDHQMVKQQIGSLCHSAQYGNSESRANSRAFSAERGKSKHNTERPSSDDVFNFMVKSMCGRGTPEDIRIQSRFFPTDVDISDWFRKNKSRFTLIERSGSISHVLVYNKQVTCCLDYNRMDSCSRSDCHRYHICKNMLSGKCVYGRKNCKFSHDCFDENNIKVSNELGYSSLFTNEEICSILKVSFPHVCTTWALKGCCEEPRCFGLHICPKYILGKCNNGPNCPQVHDRKTDHNKPILDAFEMSEMQYNVFRWRVFMINNPAWKRKGPRSADGIVSLLPNTEPKFSNKNLVKEEEDAAGDTFICSRHLVDECRERCCKYLHSKTRLPYIWQINLFGTWLSLNESEDIERAFVDNAYSSDRIRMTYDGLDLVILLLFEPTIRARVIIHADEGPTETKARRLSTMSYNQIVESSSIFENKREGNTDDFSTQWRWYWMDDPSLWLLFEPDAYQHTLEAKYLAKQKTFTFSRENYLFNYTVSFDLMHQTNNETGKRRLIRRRPLFVTSEDVKEKSFPNTLSPVHLIETPLPESWMPWDLAQPFELVDISDSNYSELEEVTKLFFNTLDCQKVKIDTISRLQNHKLWGLFCSQEMTMDANARRVERGTSIPVDKRYLFHGTDGIDAVRGICVNNFDVRVSGKTGTLYGDGAYFARDAKYSHAYTKGPERYTFVVNVLVGNYTKGNKSYRRPPHKPGSDHELFDSCVDDNTDPSIFVVFDKNQYYPEYLIKYHDEEQETVVRKKKDRTTATASISQQSASPAASRNSLAVTMQNTDQFDSLTKQQNLRLTDLSSNDYISPSSRKTYVASSDGIRTEPSGRVKKATVHSNKLMAIAKDNLQTDVVLRKSNSLDRKMSDKLVVSEQVDVTGRKLQQVIYPPVYKELFEDRTQNHQSWIYTTEQHPLYEQSMVATPDPMHYQGRASDSSPSRKRYPRTPPRSRRHLNQDED